MKTIFFEKEFLFSFPGSFFSGYGNAGYKFLEGGERKPGIRRGSAAPLTVRMSRVTAKAGVWLRNQRRANNHALNAHLWIISVTKK
jgi:hypothetical protein